MLWIFVFVYVCLFVVMIQLMMAYQKRAYTLRVKQEPIRRRIRLHKESMVETIDKLQAAVEGRLDEMLEEVSVYQKQTRVTRGLLAKWKEIVPEATELAQEQLETPDGEEYDDETELIRKADLRDMRALIVELAIGQQELEAHSEGVDRDTQLVKDTLNRLESRVKRPNQPSQAN